MTDLADAIANAVPAVDQQPEDTDVARSIYDWMKQRCAGRPLFRVMLQVITAVQARGTPLTDDDLETIGQAVTEEENGMWPGQRKRLDAADAARLAAQMAAA